MQNGWKLILFDYNQEIGKGIKPQRQLGKLWVGDGITPWFKKQNNSNETTQYDSRNLVSNKWSNMSAMLNNSFTYIDIIKMF